MVSGQPWFRCALPEKQVERSGLARSGVAFYRSQTCPFRELVQAGQRLVKLERDVQLRATAVIARER